MKFVVNHSGRNRVYNVFFEDVVEFVDLYLTGMNHKDVNGKRYKFPVAVRTTICDIRVDLSEFAMGATGYSVGTGESHCGPKDNFVRVNGMMRALGRAINAAFPVKEDRKQAWTQIGQLPGWNNRVGVKANKAKVTVNA